MKHLLPIPPNLISYFMQNTNHGDIVCVHACEIVLCVFKVIWYFFIMSFGVKGE
jgi:hypothetical protein